MNQWKQPWTSENRCFHLFGCLLSGQDPVVLSFLSMKQWLDTCNSHLCNFAEVGLGAAHATCGGNWVMGSKKWRQCEIQRLMSRVLGFFPLAPGERNNWLSPFNWNSLKNLEPLSLTFHYRANDFTFSKPNYTSDRLPFDLKSGVLSFYALDSQSLEFLETQKTASWDVLIGLKLYCITI